MKWLLILSKVKWSEVILLFKKIKWSEVKWQIITFSKNEVKWSEKNSQNFKVKWSEVFLCKRDHFTLKWEKSEVEVKWFWTLFSIISHLIWVDRKFQCLKLGYLFIEKMCCRLYDNKLHLDEEISRQEWTFLKIYFVAVFVYLHNCTFIKKLLFLCLISAGRICKLGWLRNFHHAGLEAQDDPVV